MNILNPFRGTLVIGSPGSGKTYTVITSFIEQHLKKGFSMLVYDFKFDDLTKATFSALSKCRQHKQNTSKFYVLNFDDVRTSHRCNAIHPSHLQSIYDAYEAAHSILLNLNKA
ncbi:type IV secretory system conjugative DNA transfer family protein [Myroides sp. LJL116]